MEHLYDTHAKERPYRGVCNDGGETSKLQSFAIRLLSQVGNSSFCERNWSTIRFYSFIEGELIRVKESGEPSVHS